MGIGDKKYLPYDGNIKSLIREYLLSTRFYNYLLIF